MPYLILQPCCFSTKCAYLIIDKQSDYTQFLICCTLFIRQNLHFLIHSKFNQTFLELCLTSCHPSNEVAINGVSCPLLPIQNPAMYLLSKPKSISSILYSSFSFSSASLLGLCIGRHHQIYQGDHCGNMVSLTFPCYLCH